MSHDTNHAAQTAEAATHASDHAEGPHAHSDAEALREALRQQKAERVRSREEARALRRAYRDARRRERAQARETAQEEKRRARAERDAHVQASGDAQRSARHASTHDDVSQILGLLAELATHVGRVIGRGAWAGASHARACANEVVEFVDADVRTQIKEVPLIGALQLLPHDPVLRRQDDGDHPPLLLIHGLGGSAGNFGAIRAWLRWKRPRPVHVFDYRGYGDMENAAEAFGRWVDEVVALYPEQRVEILAHSMGGLLTRLALLDHARARHIAHVYTLGTPHQGSNLARWGGARFVQELRPGSAIFERLNAEEHSPLPYALTCFWSARDVFVLPAENAIFPGAHVVPVHDSSHLGWLLQPRFFAVVFEEIDRGRRAQRLLSARAVNA